MQASVDAIFCFLIFVEHREVGLLWGGFVRIPLDFSFPICYNYGENIT